jgi:hypothetical protein
MCTMHIVTCTMTTAMHLLVVWLAVVLLRVNLTTSRAGNVFVVLGAVDQVMLCAALCALYKR